MQAALMTKRQGISTLKHASRRSKARSWGLFTCEAVSAGVAIELIRIVLGAFDFDSVVANFAAATHMTNALSGVPLNAIVLWLSIGAMMMFACQLSADVAQMAGYAMPRKAKRLLVILRWGSAVAFSLCASYCAALDIWTEIALDAGTAHAVPDGAAVLGVFSTLVLVGVWFTGSRLRYRVYLDGKPHRIVRFLQTAPLAQWVVLAVSVAVGPWAVISVLVVAVLAVLSLFAVVALGVGFVIAVVIFLLGLAFLGPPRRYYW